MKPQRCVLNQSAWNLFENAGTQVRHPLGVSAHTLSGYGKSNASLEYMKTPARMCMKLLRMLGPKYGDNTGHAVGKADAEISKEWTGRK